MKWNWQLEKWPKFTYNPSKIAALDWQFLQGAGGIFAVLKHLEGDPKKQFIVEILSTEGVKSAEIEGERLERESLQSSIQRHFGLLSKDKKIPAKECGMSELLCDVYDTFDEPLKHSTLHKWHRLLMESEKHISDKGKYRTHQDPMQIVSGRLDKQQVYFEAPPSKRLRQEMTKYVHWFNHSRKGMSPLVRASVAHIYFESIHPFEDGNGRIGRALVEKVLSQSVGHPILIAVSEEIAKRRKDYYKALAKCNRTLEISGWIQFFSQLIVKSQETSSVLINFLMSKYKMMSALDEKLNQRQEKVLLRMFAKGPKGFSGGLSAENYIAISKTSRATATRDLADLVELGALRKTGRLKHTRYYLDL